MPDLPGVIVSAFVPFLAPMAVYLLGLSLLRDVAR